MINISKDIRIRQVDNFSMTFDVYRVVKKSPLNKEERYDWAQEGGYYGTLCQCLKAIKDYIIKEENKRDDNLDILKLLDEINNKYVNTFIKCKKEKE